MRVRGVIEFEIDDELFAAHDGEHVPPPNEIEDWDFRDLFRASEQSLIDEDENALIELERVS